MIIVNYRSKRELKKAIGKPLAVVYLNNNYDYDNGKLFFVTNIDDTFKATITMDGDKIKSVR